jgi:hypothetical protein
MIRNTRDCGTFCSYQQSARNNMGHQEKRDPKDRMKITHAQ